MGSKLFKQPVDENNKQRSKKKKHGKRKHRHREHGKHSRHHHRKTPENIEDGRSSHHEPTITNDEQIISQDEIIPEIHKTEDTVSEDSVIVDDFVDIEVADSEAFNHVFIQQRQQAINNTSYRSIIESWRPNSLQQLVDSIKNFIKGKSFIDRHWIIFYWITFTIEYDTVSYFSKDFKDQTAEGVFLNRKGVCAGYGNLYKYLCDQLQLPCESVGGYSKGYGFDDRESAEAELDHAWNAVEIYNHWYLMEPTWGAGHLDDKKEFKRELSTYYFLPRPNEMIYHHLPEHEKWQLLQRPIKMPQYMQMPHLRHNYFEFNLETIQPRNQYFVNLEQDKPYALVIMKTPTDVHLIADLKLHDKIIDGGHQVIFDRKKRLYYCYFAPANIGKNKVTIYAKRGDSDLGTHSAVLDLTFLIKQMPENPISYPRTWKIFFDFGLKILSPQRTHLINLDNGEKFTQIVLRTPSDIILIGQLKNQKEEIIHCGDRVYYDREKDFWRCKFAPNQNGIFDAIIMAKNKSDPGSYTSAVSFKINANQITSPPFTFPKTWQLFYDLDLKLLSPVGRGIIILREKTPFAEIRIQTPDDVELLGQLQNNKNETVVDGDEVHYDKEKNYWQCRFAPNGKGIFNGIIMAKKKSDSGSYTSVISFQIIVKQLPAESSALPILTQVFHNHNLKLISPLNCNTIIQSAKSSFVEICLKTPNDVQLIGQLVDDNKAKVLYADQVYYDRHKDIWRCKFAPNHSGMFDAVIMAKKISDTNHYVSAVTFHIEANHIHTPPLTFPYRWPLFYDFDLRIEAPRSRSTVVWSENASYAEILLQAPVDIQLTCCIEYENTKIENGSLAQFDDENKLWQFLFAPERTGLHELIIFAKRIDANQSSYNPVVKFDLNVTKLRRPMKFPNIFTQFETTKCRIYTPIDGILKKGSVVPIHCIIPGASAVTITVGSKTLKAKGYEDPVFQRQITVGSEEITIHAKYGQTPHYTSLIKYSVE